MKLRQLPKLAVVLLACLATVAFALVANDRPRAYRAARIWTAVGEPIRDGVLVVDRGKITAVGKRGEVKLPAGASEADLGDAVIIPGLVVAQTNLAERGQDDEQSITPEVRAIDGFDAYDTFRRAIAGGVTTVQISAGSRRLIPGQGAVVKLAGPDPASRTLSAAESLRVLLGDAAKNPPKIYEPAIPADPTNKPLVPAKNQLPTSRAGAVAAVRATLKAATAYRQNLAEKSKRDLAMEAVLKYMGQGRPVRFTAPEAVDVRAAFALAKEFGLRVTLVDPVEVHQFKDEYAAWAKAGVSVILNAEFRPGRVSNDPPRAKDSPERRPAWDNARELLAAGVPVTFRPVDDADLDDMLFIGSRFSAAGIEPRDVLRMLTVQSAEILGVADRVGSLAAGRDADFVVLSDDPFASHSAVREVYVGGERVFESKAPRDYTVVRAKSVYTGTGSPIPGGSLLIEGSKIRAVGPDVSAPLHARIVGYEDAVIAPGMIDLYSQLGVSNPAAAGGITMQTKLTELLAVDDPAVAVAREGGVTTVLAVPAGPGPAPVMAFKLGDNPRVLRDPAGVKFTVGGNLTSQVPSLRSTLQRGKAYADSWTKYDKDQADYEQKKKEYDAAKAKADAEQKKEADKKKEEPKKEGEPKKPETEPKKESEKPVSDPAKKDGEQKKEGEAKKDGDAKKDATQKPAAPALPPEPKAPTKPSTDASLEPYRALFAGQAPALVEAVRIEAIRAAIALFHDEFKLRTVLVRAEDAFRVPEAFANKQVSVAVGPDLVRVVDDSPINLAQVLANHATRFGFQSGGTTGSKHLPLAVSYAVRQGLGTSDALAGLTTWPAEMLGLDGQIGRIAAGHDADLVVLSGPPLDPSSRVLAVMIDGQWVHKAEGVK